jgi:hypothetical protein
MIGFGNRFRLSGELKERNMRFAILSDIEFDSIKVIEDGKVSMINNQKHWLKTKLNRL